MPAPSFAVAVALALCALLISSSAEEEPRLLSNTPRPAGVQPRLSISPSNVESCVTPVVTLECSAGGGLSLQARIKSSQDDGDQDGDSSMAEFSVVASMKIYKRTGKSVTGEDEWKVFAELGDSDYPSGSALDYPGVEVTGNVKGSASGSYIRVIWDLAADDTFGVYRCDVTVLQTGGASGPQADQGTVSSEPLAVENPSAGNGGSEEEILNSLRQLTAEGHRELEWRAKVDEGMEKIVSGIKILDMFARGNAYKLHRVLDQLAAFSTTTKPATTTTTTTTTTTPKPTTTTPKPPRTFAPFTGPVDNTKSVVVLGIAGGKQTSTLAPTPSTSAPVTSGRRRPTGRRDWRANRRNQNNNSNSNNRRGRRVGRDTRVLQSQ